MPAGTTSTLYIRVGVWLTHVRANRLVNSERTEHRHVSDIHIAPKGRVVLAKDSGLVQIFLTVFPDGHAELYVTNRFDMKDVSG